MKHSIAAPKVLHALDRRLNSAAGIRLLFLVFLGTATVFFNAPNSVLSRRPYDFDYELWYATGKT